jgi:hypothetical protein
MSGFGSFQLKVSRSQTRILVRSFSDEDRLAFVLLKFLPEGIISGVVNVPLRQSPCVLVVGPPELEGFLDRFCQLRRRAYRGLSFSFVNHIQGRTRPATRVGAGPSWITSSSCGTVLQARVEGAVKLWASFLNSLLMIPWNYLRLLEMQPVGLRIRRRP